MSLDRERCETIADAAMIAIRQNYLRGPSHPDRVFEALNGLAFALAATLAKIDQPDLRQWFIDAVDSAVEEFKADGG
jgi:hypothetical protein